MSIPSYADPPFACPPDVTAGLNEVLLQAALRAERINANKAADERARDLAERMDERAGMV